MNTTNVLRVMRNKLADNGEASPTWSDQELLDAIHSNASGMMQERVKQDETYHNATLRLWEDEARQMAPGIFEWLLGSMVYKLIHVREWTEEDEGLLTPLTMAARDEWPVRANRWQFSGSRRLVVGLSEAKDLAVQYAKSPAKMLRYTVDLDTESSDDEIWFPQTLDFTHDDERGAYVNARLEVVGVVSGSDADTPGGRSMVGEQRVVVESGRVHHAELDVYRGKLTVNSAFSDSIKVGHKIESHVEFDDAHMEYLLLSAQETCLQKTDNALGIQTIGRRIARERGKWFDHIQRETGGPAYIANAQDPAASMGSQYSVSVDPDWDFI